jgi:hypothetical protein
MPTTVTDTGITFNDATVQNTAAVSANTNNVLSATAAAAAGAVGTYVLAAPIGPTPFTIGATFAGSNLQPSSALSGFQSTSATSGVIINPTAALSGTWRAMCSIGSVVSINGGVFNLNIVGLFLRIA